MYKLPMVQTDKKRGHIVKVTNQHGLYVNVQNVSGGLFLFLVPCVTSGKR